MNTPSTRHEYSPAEALWAMYMSQSKSVQKAFRLRLRAEEEAEAQRRRMEVYAQTLPADELEAAEQMAERIKRSVADIRAAATAGKPTGRPAEELLAELMEQA